MSVRHSPQFRSAPCCGDSIAPSTALLLHALEVPEQTLETYLPPASRGGPPRLDVAPLDQTQHRIGRAPNNARGGGHRNPALCRFLVPPV